MKEPYPGYKEHRKANENYWRSYGIRNIDDFNTYSAYLASKRNKSIKIAAFIVIAVFIAALILSRIILN